MAHKSSVQNVVALGVKMLGFCLAAALMGCGLGNPALKPTPSPVATVPPTSASLSLPDLAIGDIALEQERQPAENCPLPAGGLKVRVEVVNRGSADAGPFVVEVNQVQQNVSPGLVAGENVTLYFPISVLQVDVSIDVTARIVEGSKSNNRISRTLVIPTPSAECAQTSTPQISSQLASMIMLGHTGKVLSVAFAPDGNLIASGSVDNTLRLWQASTGKLVRTMQGHPFPILALKFSPTGANLATGSTDGLLRLWQVSNGSLVRTLKGHAGWITGLDFSADGKYLVSCADDFTVRVWRISDGKLLQTIDEGMASVTSVAFSPDGQRIAWSEVDGVVRLRTFSGIWLHIMKTESGAAASVAFSPQGEWLASGHQDGSIRIWNVEDGTLLQTLRGHTGAVTSLSFSPGDRWLVSGSKDSTLRLWSLDIPAKQITPYLIYAGHTGPVNSVDFSPKATLVVSGSDDQTVRLWPVPK